MGKNKKSKRIQKIKKTIKTTSLKKKMRRLKNKKNNKNNFKKNKNKVKQLEEKKNKKFKFENEDEEFEIPEGLEEIMMTEEQLENLPHDEFKTYIIPKTKEEHKKNLFDLIKRSDLILEFIDIRNVKGTRCEKIEKEIKDKNKVLILVLAKVDLVSKEFLDKIYNTLKKKNLVLILSSFIREKVNIMFDKLKKIVNDNLKKNKKIKIGIIGYPNMGKNLFIQSIQLINNANSDDKIIYFNNNKNFGIDCVPGTIFEKDDDNTLFISKEFKEISKIPKPEKLIKNILDYVDKKKIKEIYNFKEFHNFDDLIKEFCRKFKYDNKNIKLVSQHIINDIIEGKIIYEIN